MCGIAGIVNFEARDVLKDELQAMTRRMVYRGPDDEGFLCAGRVGFGMRRLSIIDVGGGHQPIYNEDGTVAVVMNGEIYNFKELRMQLKSRGHVFKTDSDTEVIVHLYEDKGADAVHELNGMFGFALWDARRGAVWVVRDRLGIKPIYFLRDRARVAFASDLNALRGAGELTLSADALLQYLALSYVPSPATIYQGVEKLPAGHFIWIESGNVAVKRYWEIREMGTWQGNGEAAKEQLRALLVDAVKLQLRSDVPLGVFLSGGLDSSTIAALAAGQITEPLRTLTIEFTGKGAADARFARVVAEQYRTQHAEIAFGTAAALEGLDDLLRRLDEPIGDSAIIPSYLLSKYARDNGLKVLLTGAGGDEIFGGYSRHWPSRFGSPTWIADTLPGPLRRGVSALWSQWQPTRGARMGDPIVAMAAGISGVDLHAMRCLLRDRESHNTMLAAIQGEFAELPAMEQRWGRAYGRMSLDVRKYLVEDVLALSDKATMAASVEGRVPLLDHRVVEFAFSLPSATNLADGRPKGLLRSAMTNILPAELLGRSKEGFNAPVHLWLDGSGEMGIAEELIETPVALVRELICPRTLRVLLNDPRARHAAASTLFSLFLFNRWCRVQHGLS